MYRAIGPNEILFIRPESGTIRARNVVSRSNARPTSKYPSVKMGRMMQAESEGELAAFRLNDTDPTVRSFHEQPLTILYYMDGQARRHFPDIGVERHFQQVGELREVKTSQDARDPEVLARTWYLTETLPRYGFTYHLDIAEDLKSHPFLKTAKLLLRHGHVAVDDLAREQVRRILEAKGFLTWASAQNGALGRSGRSLLCRLTLEGYLDFDRSQPLTSATNFHLAPPRKGV